MKKILICVVVCLFISNLIVVGGQDSSNPAVQPQTDTQTQQQPGSQQRPILDEYGEFTEMVYGDRAFAFIPKRYSVISLYPAGHGTLGIVSVFTYRPKQLLWMGYLSENGAKFTALQASVHYIWVTTIGTGERLSISYKPSGNSATMSQDDRVKLSFEYGQRVDAEEDALLKKLKEERERRRQQQSQQQRAQQPQQQNPAQPQQ